MAPKTRKSSLKIRLAESVVFLRGSTDSTIFGRRVMREAQPAMLRGLLVLELEQPTKISSVELTFEGKTQTTWPEGVGARRVDLMEEQKLFSATTVYFHAGETHNTSTRRTASVGPGLHYDRDDIEDDGPEEARLVHSPPGTDTPPSLRSAMSRRRVSMDCQNYLNFGSRPQASPRNSLENLPAPPYSPPGTRPGSFRRNDSNQSVSVAATPAPLSLGQRADSWRSGRGNADQHGVYEVRHSSNRSQDISEPPSGASSIHSPSAIDLSLSRPQSHEDEPSTSSAPTLERSPSRGRTRDLYTGRRLPDSASQSRAQSILRSSSTFPTPFGSGQVFTPISSESASASNSAFSHPAGDHASDSPNRERGRRHARFSLASVSNALLDAVKERLRSNSPHTHAGLREARSRDQSPDGIHSRSSRAPSVIRESSIDPEHRRGRTQARDAEIVKGKEKERSTLGRIGGALGLDVEGKHGENWKEFRKGSYTYPISFAIPGDCPPSLRTEFGAVTYQLKAAVHRPGTFTQKLTASREVVLISSPGEDDLDEIDNIVVQREWDSQMHYAIIISGRAFAIGSSIPLHITFMPLTKVKIFRLTAVVEEKIEYAPQFKRIPRTDVIRRFELLSIRCSDKESPILPLLTDYGKSPLRGYVDIPDESEAASSLMGPGPWAIVADLKLPTSCTTMHCTNKHKRSHIRVSHMLKIIFRVERGDDAFTDAKTGARKHFDIVVQTPLHILSCRCNTEWTTLPRYSFLSLDTHMETPACPCERQRTSAAERKEATTERPDALSAPASSSSIHRQRGLLLNVLHHTDGRMEAPTSTTVDQPVYQHTQLERIPSASPSVGSLYRNNALFARLVAGEETEQGEAPPQYDQVVALESPRHDGVGVVASAETVSA